MVQTHCMDIDGNIRDVSRIIIQWTSARLLKYETHIIEMCDFILEQSANVHFLTWDQTSFLQRHLSVRGWLNFGKAKKKITTLILNIFTYKLKFVVSCYVKT